MTTRICLAGFKRKLKWAAFGALSPLLLIGAQADAALVGYQGQAAFDAAIAGLSSNTTDFESIAPGTSYAPGTGPAGSGFSLNLSGADSPQYAPTVSNQFWTTSGTNYLGLNNPDSALETGDSLTFTFQSPVSAFGLFVIGSQDVGAGDISLTSGGVTIANGASADLTDGVGDFAYYIGLASNDATQFTSVTLSVLNPQSARLLPIDVDDVTLASSGGQPIPEPDALVLCLLGGLMLPAAAYIKRRRRKVRCRSL